MVERLSIDEARNVVLRAQGFAAAPPFANPVEMLDHLSAVQLDTISVLARSHELVTYARLGAIGRATVDEAYWHSGQAFEYFAHAACILPLRLWPYFAFRRRAWTERTREQRIEPGIADARRSIAAEVYRDVRARLADGPVTVQDVGGGRSSPGWWNWSEAKLALEILYFRGEVAITTRNGWARVYDLAERAIPSELLTTEPSDEECFVRLVDDAARTLGVATRRDLAEHWNLTWGNITGPLRWQKAVELGIEGAGLVPVTVEGWKEEAFAHPAALTSAHAPDHRPTVLSPFDQLIWAPRRRIDRLFAFDYLFEAYVPSAKRVHGYFTMPLLARGRLVGRVDPAREGTTLVARRITMDAPEYVEDLASALKDAAAWVNCDSVRVEEFAPKGLKRSLERLLK